MNKFKLVYNGIKLAVDIYFQLNRIRTIGKKGKKKCEG